MISVNGYFDGTACVPLEKIDAKPFQRVIITVLDASLPPSEKEQGSINEGLALLKKFTGCIDREIDEKKELLEALDEKRTKAM